MIQVGAIPARESADWARRTCHEKMSKPAPGFLRGKGAIVKCLAPLLLASTLSLPAIAAVVLPTKARSASSPKVIGEDAPIFLGSMTITASPLPAHCAEEPAADSHRSRRGVREEHRDGGLTGWEDVADMLLF